MVSKILSISGSKISDYIHPDGERSKRNSSGKNHDQQHSLEVMISHEEKELKNNQNNERSTIFQREELTLWINELNEFDCYRLINLKFIIEDEGEKILIYLKDQKNHCLQEYLPLQIKAIHSQFKKDLTETPKGTILNITC